MAKKVQTTQSGKSTQLPTKVLGLDLSLNRTGWALWDNKVLTHGVIKVPEGLDDMNRLEHIRGTVLNLAENNKPAMIMLEDFAFARPNQAHQLGGLGYLVRYFLWSKGHDYYLVPPTRLKKFTTLKGSSPKDIMIKEVFKRFGVDVNDNNIADAVALAFLGRALNGSYTSLVAAQKEVVSELEKKYSL